MKNVPKQIHDVVSQARGAVVGSGRITEQMFVFVCAALGLACMFGGIWVGDARVTAALDIKNSTLVMRLITLGVYSGFLAIVLRATAGKTIKLHGFFSKAVGVGFVAFVAGMAIVQFADPLVAGDAHTAVMWLALFLTKIIGAPLSIGLVCIFSQLDRDMTMRAAAAGMLGAFIIYNVLMQLSTVLQFHDLMGVVGSTVLIALSCLLGMMGLNEPVFGQNQYSKQGVIGISVVKRPLRQVMTTGLVCTLVFSAMMLGYLRSGYMHVDAHLQPYSVIVLAVLMVVSFAWRGLRSEHVFYVALTCTAASILLLPFLNMISVEVGVIAASVGTALFEVVVWMFAVWAAHNCVESLRAAALARFSAVVGHLLGTIAVVLAFAVAPNEVEASAAAGMLVVFAYIVLLLVILKNPGMKPPFVVHDDTYWFAESSAAPTRSAGASGGAECSATAANDNAYGIDGEKRDESGAVDVERYEDAYWTAPCKTISEMYRLTKRETEVLELLAHGYSMASMAESLCISPNTMKMHMRNIYTKLDVHSRQDAITMVDLVRSQQQK